MRYGMTLEGLKEQLHSLNMRLLFSMENHDLETQDTLEREIRELKRKIDSMAVGSGRT
jgi:hypothetical protein